MRPRFFVYIVMHPAGTALYVGVTRDLTRRVEEHRSGGGSTFAKRYRTYRLVYFEAYGRALDAIKREKQIKGWRRVRKEALIRTRNPSLRDLSADAARMMAAWRHSQI